MFGRLLAMLFMATLLMAVPASFGSVDYVRSIERPYGLPDNSELQNVEIANNDDGVCCHPYYSQPRPECLLRSETRVRERVVSDETVSKPAESVTKSVAVKSETLIPNPSVEANNGSGNPESWTRSSWGDNDPEFTYDSQGHTGQYSVKVEIKRIVDGDAKWVHDPAKITGGKNYTVSDWYRSNVLTKMVVQASDSAGTPTYIDLKAAEPAQNWTFYSDNVTLPDSAVSVVVFHVLDKEGWLATDDYELKPV